MIKFIKESLRYYYFKFKLYVKEIGTLEMEDILLIGFVLSMFFIAFGLTAYILIELTHGIVIPVVIGTLIVTKLIQIGWNRIVNG